MRFDHWYSGSPTPVAYLLKDSLEAALYGTGQELEMPRSFTGIEGFFSSNIKANKLAHRAIEAWNLPLVRSWYKYGQIVPYEELSPPLLDPEPLRTQSGTSSPPPSTTGAGKLPDRITLRDWFLELSSPTLQEIMEMELFKFLRWDYETFAGGYRDLYLTNLELLELFETIGTAGDLHGDADQYRERLQELTLDMKYEMSKIPVFHDDVRWFVERSLRTIQDGLIKFSETNSPSAQSEKAIRDSYYNYHSKVWHWPALYISIGRAEGPEEYLDQFIVRRESDAVDTGETSPKWLKSYQVELLDRGLLPETRDYVRIHAPPPDGLSAIGGIAAPREDAG